MHVSGTIRVPGDKSISHRALILAALGDGPSRLRGLLPSADVRSTAAVLRALGVAVPEVNAREVRVKGVGLRGLLAPRGDLDCGNSGTTARLMSGVLAACPFSARLVGDKSLSRRPMRRVASPLRTMGAEVACEGGDGLPMRVTGGALRGISWRTETPSAQVKSAVLLAGLVGGVPVDLQEPLPTRDHTERMLRARGVAVLSEGVRVSLAPAERLAARDTDVPGDPSSAAFLAAFAALVRDGTLAIENVCVNRTRDAALRVLAEMGASVGFEDARDEAGEPLATIVVRARALRGVSIAPERVPALIDELPLLACVASRAEGETRVTGAAALGVKESDRIATVVTNLRALGADAEELADGFVVRGSDRPLRGRVETHGDHRIAMAFGVLAALPGNAIEIDDPACVEISYPAFWKALARVAR